MGFDLGTPVAEYDDLLIDAYVDFGVYDSIRSRAKRECFLIGRTGSGKSAAFRRLEHEYPKKVVRIAPEDLAMNYLSDLQVMPYLIERGVRFDAFLKALWKHVFILEILKRRYDIQSKEQIESIKNSWTQKIRRDAAMTKAVTYLSEFWSRFWNEADGPVKHFTHSLERKFEAEGAAKIAPWGTGISVSGNAGRTERDEMSTDERSRFQRIVNDSQLTMLSDITTLLNTHILDPQHFMYIVIDDLDTDWVEADYTMLLIRCLFDAVKEMQKLDHLKILVALRTNIHQQLGDGKGRPGHQQEKINALTLELRWEERQLAHLLERRIEAASASSRIDPPWSMEDLFPKGASGRNDGQKQLDPLAYILSRTLMRPRDAIVFINEYLKVAIRLGGTIDATMANIYRAEKAYSVGRLQALRDEWQNPYVGIDEVFAKFRFLPIRLSRGELTDVFHNIAALHFTGSDWLIHLCEPIYWAGSDERPWIDCYGGVLRLLYAIGFLGVVEVVRGNAATYSYDNPDLLARGDVVDEGTSFEVQPAFWKALDMAQTEE